MRNLIIGIALFGLCGCTSPMLITQKATTPKISNDFFKDCKVVDKYPNFRKLTDRQVGQLLNTLDTNNRKCKAILDAVRDYLEKAALITNE